MKFNNSGSLNVAVGNNALLTNTTGVNNTAVGTEADVTSANLNNATAIGFQAKVNASNKVRIGNSAVTVIEGQVAYTFPSDGRFKTQVADDIKGLDFILKLRPVSYHFQTKKYDAFIKGEDPNVQYASAVDYTTSEKLRHNGFIAQEVEKAAKETNYYFDGVIAPKNNKERYGLSYSQFVVPLVKAVQELSRNNDELKMMNVELKTSFISQQPQIEQMKKENAEIKSLLLQMQKEINQLKNK